MTNTEETTMTTTTRSNTKRRAARLGLAALMAGMSLLTLGAGSASAGLNGEAEVVCNDAYNTIEVTPRVLANGAEDQFAAHRVWLAEWTGWSWRWTAGEWVVEEVAGSQNPGGFDISRRSTQTLRPGDGYYLVYVEAWMWNGQSWSDHDGSFTTSYTQVTPSVSFEPDTSTQSRFCRV